MSAAAEYQMMRDLPPKKETSTAPDQAGPNHVIEYATTDSADKTKKRLNLWSAKLGWTLLIGALFAWRGYDRLAHPQLWAEDGGFLTGAIAEGLGVTFVQAAGYFHLLPRLIAWLATRFDPAWIPAVFVYSSFALTLATIWRIFSPRFHFQGKPWLALAIVAVPHTGEVYLNPTNLQWIVVFMLVVTCLSDDPNTIGEWFTDIATVGIAGLTGPFCLFLGPSFLMRSLARQTRASWCLVVFVGLVAILQGWQIWFHTPLPPSWHPRGPIQVYQAIVVLAKYIPISLLAGELWMQHITPWAAATIGVMFAMILAWLISARDSQRLQRLALVGFLTIFLTVVVLKVRVDFWENSEHDADRYFFIPKVVVLWLIVSSAAKTTARGWAGLGLSTITFLAAAAVFRLAALPRYEWNVTREKLSNGKSMEVQINPGWNVALPPLERWHR